MSDEQGTQDLKTPFDWLSVLVFAGLAVLFLHRSTSNEEPKDNILMYAPPAIGCMFANYVGNQEDLPYHDLIGGLILAAVVGYIFHILKPFPRKS